MPVDSIPALQKEVEDALAAASRLSQGDAGSDATLEAFQKLNRALQQASQKQDELQKALEEVPNKDLVFRFLFLFHERKKLYRRQVAVAMGELLRVGAWRLALESRADLRHALPAELQEVVKEAWDKAAAEPASTPTASTALPDEEEVERRSSSACMSGAQGDEAADAAAITRPPSQAEVRAAVDKAKEEIFLRQMEQSRSQAAKPIERDPASLRKELEEAFKTVSRLSQGDAGSDPALEAFHRLRRGMEQTANQQEVLRNALESIVEKEEVLRFLFSFHEKKRRYRRQMAVVLAVLLRVLSWRLVLESTSDLKRSMPSDLAEVVKDAIEKGIAEEAGRAADKKGRRGFNPASRLPPQSGAGASVEGSKAPARAGPDVEVSRDLFQSDQTAVLQRQTQGSFQDGRWALICPWAHVIDQKVEEALSKRFFGLLQPRCELCNDVFGESENRWTCSEGCNFVICNKCYVDQPGGALNSGERRGSRSRARSSSLTGFVRKSWSKTPGETGSSRQHRRSSSIAGAVAPQIQIADVLVPPYMLQQDGDVTRFGIIVTPEGGASQWMVFHRYNDFKRLNDSLCNTGEPLIDAPFPRQHMRKLNEERLEERRVKLEAWLKQAVARRPFPKEWTEPLRHFLNVACDGRSPALNVPGCF
mmetsp:Transcript_60782/g.112778  ORF Transcript_60782/g.112778 Transcript_60782/m.112778 type:complete len:649 (-) Transcript_60782:78-2024(-)